MEPSPSKRPRSEPKRRASSRLHNNYVAAAASQQQTQSPTGKRAVEVPEAERKQTSVVLDVPQDVEQLPAFSTFTDSFEHIVMQLKEQAEKKAKEAADEKLEEVGHRNDCLRQEIASKAAQLMQLQQFSDQLAARLRLLESANEAAKAEILTRNAEISTMKEREQTLDTALQQRTFQLEAQFKRFPFYRVAFSVPYFVDLTIEMSEYQALSNHFYGSLHPQKRPGGTGVLAEAPKLEIKKIQACVLHGAPHPACLCTRASRSQPSPPARALTALPSRVGSALTARILFGSSTRPLTAPPSCPCVSAPPAAPR